MGDEGTPPPSPTPLIRVEETKSSPQLPSSNFFFF